MPDVTGEALRAWRRSRGWDRSEMAKRLRQAADGQVADKAGLVRMIAAWERGDHAISERYELLYRQLGFPVGGSDAWAQAWRVADRAAWVPDPDIIAAMAEAALARDDLPPDEVQRVRDLADRAMEDIRQVGQRIARLRELLGDD